MGGHIILVCALPARVLVHVADARTTSTHTIHTTLTHSDTPFCHTTYIVCTNGLPTQFTCPNETVWSQANKTCINRADGPGQCPVCV